MRFAVGGRAAATAGLAASEVLGALWNPSATVPLKVSKFGFAWVAGANPGLALRRTTTRGTPGSTETPDADNELNRLAAPASGAVLDLAAFTAMPTLSGGAGGAPLMRLAMGSNLGDFAEMRLGGLRVPPGTGLALVQVASNSLTVDTMWEWEE